MRRQPNAETQPVINPLGDLLTVARRLHPRLEWSPSLTFHYGGDFTASSSCWLADVFAPVILPALLAALGHARAVHVRELAEIEQRLARALGAEASLRSLAAGANLNAAAAALRGDRIGGRIQHAIQCGALSGHFPVVFAARCASFSISDRIAVAAYAFMEVSLATPPPDLNSVEGFVSACLVPFEARFASPALRAA